MALPPMLRSGGQPAPTGPSQAAPAAAWTPPVIAGGGGSTAKKKPPRSLWNQVTDIVTGIIPGVANLTKTAVESSPLGMATRAGYRANQGKAVNFNPVSEDYNPQAHQMTDSMLRTGGDIIHPTHFARAIRSGTILDKILEDAGNVAMVAAPAAKALGMGAEAASAAGATRTAAVLGTGEKIAQYAHSVTGPIGDAPISIPRKLITYAGEGTRAGVNALAEGAGPLSGAASGLRDLMPVTFDESGRAINAGLKTEFGARTRAVARASRELFKGGQMEKDPALQPTLAEQGAATAIMANLGSADKFLREAGLSPEDARLAHAPQAIPEQTFTPDVAEVTRQYIDGTLEPASRARVERVIEANKPVIAKSTERALAGSGRFKGGLDPEMLGHQPIDKYVVDALKEAGVSQTDIDAMNLRRTGEESWHDLAQHYPVLKDVLANPMVYAKIWRPALRAIALGNAKLAELFPGGTLDPAEGHVRMFRGESVDLPPPSEMGDLTPEQQMLAERQGRWFTSDKSYAQEYASGTGKRLRYVDVPEDVHARIGGLADQPEFIQNRAFAQDRAAEAIVPPEFTQHISDYVEGQQRRLPTNPTELMAMGMEQPSYFSSASSDLAQPWLARTPGERTNLGMPGFRGVSSENMAVSNEFLPMSTRTLAESIGNEAGRTAFNEHMFKAMGDAKLPTIADVLGHEQTQAIVDQATAEARAQPLTASQTKRFVGERLHNALLQAGHSPIIGDLNAPAAGAFDMGAAVKFEDVSPNTPALRTAVKNKLTQRWANPGGGVPGQVMDWINKKFKGNVLPFSLRWQLGDAIGGAFMAWAGGGVNPAEMVASMRDLKHLDPVAAEQLFNHPDFADASLTRGEQQIMRQGPDAPTPKTPIGKFKQASFRINNKINELNRHAYLLAKTDKLLAEHGLSVDRLGGDEAAWQRPEVQKAVTAAVDDAMKVMGSFDEMSPFEQRYMKRVFPFWAWNRHITALALRTAIDNPARLMWTMRLGSYGSDPNSDLPAFLKGNIGLPGGLSIPTSSLNPFADVLGGDPIYTPSGAMRSTSPGIKLGVAALTGADMTKGLAQITRPGSFGAKPSPLIAHPFELAYQAAKVLPISRVAMDLAPTMKVGGVGLGPRDRRFSGGAPISKYGNDSRITKLFPLFGLPITKPSTGK